jgi:hypothetical protein
VTIPKDFAARDEFLAGQIARSALRRHEGKEGKEVGFEPGRVFQSVRRYVLKEFMKDGESRENVLLLEDEGVGLIRFVFAEGGFRDPAAEVQVIPSADQGSRVIVSLPMDPTIRRQVLESRLLKAITEDLAETGTRERTP